MEDKRILHLSSEKGKFIVNDCLDSKLFINTLKLQKMLIIAHGEMLSRYDKPLFKEKVMTSEYGLFIPEVEKDFLMYENEFNQRLPIYVSLNELEEEIINEVVEIYGSFGQFKINNVEELQKLKQICYKKNSRRVVPNDIIKEVFNEKNNRIGSQSFVKKLKK